MKFPNIEVQPHWLATLERAVKAMPCCRWVCTALDNGVEPKIEKEVIAAISKAISPNMLVNTWYYRETGSHIQKSQEYRIAWLNHMIEQCLEMQQAMHQDEVEEEVDSEYVCPHCGGTGEGQYDGQSCSYCKGKGY